STPRSRTSFSTCSTRFDLTGRALSALRLRQRLARHRGLALRERAVVDALQDGEHREIDARLLVPPGLHSLARHAHSSTDIPPVLPVPRRRFLERRRAPFVL